MSEIYPIDELEWENNSNGAAIRPAILNLAELDDDQCGQLLDTLNELNLADERPVAALIGLAPDAGSRNTKKPGRLRSTPEKGQKPRCRKPAGELQA